jgi:hypothetical protein
MTIKRAILSISLGCFLISPMASWAEEIKDCYHVSTSTLLEYLSLFIMFLLTTGRIDRGLPFTVADFHLTDDLLYGGIPPR